MAKIGKAVVGIKTVNVTNKVLISTDLFNRLKELTAEVSEESSLLSHALELRSLARRIVEEAELP